MQAMSASAGAPQRSPFAIQELLGLSEGREAREGREERERERYEGEAAAAVSRYARGPFAPQFPLPASVASRVAYAAAFNAQAAVAAAFLPGPPMLHAPPGKSNLSLVLATLCGASPSNHSTPDSIRLLRKIPIR
ncbi:hypothetical protein RR48_08805 [Papilio machaon]|uniref:Uncharacterized protein n=1 Tax=Papilio machaon TaxID=76193 RepID=A0A194RIP7_PAPMA|nr:hypothetical protein RR48_08805 [Papilio machaon]